MKIRFLIFFIGISVLISFPIHAIKLKVLMNAEPFGFGPSAAIAEIFPYLRNNIQNLSYIGSGHTLDLQKKLNYNEIYDYGTDLAKQKTRFFEIAKNYDVFVTATNFEAAEWAKELGLALIIYDPLTWYWNILPPIIKKSDLYIAQNFFGVAERIKKDQEKLPETVIVPALIPEPSKGDIKTNENTILVNMGGLSNPFISNDVFVIFAKMVFGSVNDIFGTKFNDITYVTSTAIAQATNFIHQPKTLQPQQIQKILSSSKLAIMTSGLGNIYEASALKRFIIWLPPANDSQGQQIKLLMQHGMLDFAVDWHEILEDEKPIDYFAPQQQTLKRIASCMQKLANNRTAENRFKNILNNAVNALEKGSRRPSLAKLAEHFGTGGAKQAAEAIHKKLTRIETQKNEAQLSIKEEKSINVSRRLLNKPQSLNKWCKYRSGLSKNRLVI